LGDPLRQIDLLEGEAKTAILRVLERGEFTPGAEVQSLEEEFSLWLGRKSSVATGSGHAALEGALFALEIGRGDEVAVCANLDISAVGPISRRGATPHFVDIAPGTTGMDPAALATSWSQSLRAVLVVHTYGYPAPVHELAGIARMHGAAVVEDISHAPGAWIEQQRVGSVGDITVMSCASTKPLAAVGNAGMASADDPELIRNLREYIAYGFDSTSLLAIHRGDPGARYRYATVGINGMPDELQAAVLRLKLARIDDWAVRRRDNMLVYQEAIESSGSDLILPIALSEGDKPAPRYYVAQARRERDLLVSGMRQRGVAATLGYLPTLNHQAVFSHLPEANLSATDAFANSMIGFPLAPELSKAEVSTAATILHEMLAVL
jgi:dTDP-4-amino-4,6-dideoxygalactose transaminase